ncbi:MAG: hypothetical protein VX346_27610 [Planctomycetota bacterium]|nr:hypothetical protein [Planctomycetota bacterium]
MYRSPILKFTFTLASAVASINGCDNVQAPTTNLAPGAKPVAPHPPREGSTTKTVLLSGPEARRRATEFINRELRGRTSRGPNGEVVWRPVSALAWHSVIYNFRNQRIQLRMGGSGGWEAHVTMGPQGETPQVEHAEFAWD